MARELGPKNIHVAHVVIDGVIDNRRSRERMAEHVKNLPDDGLLATDAIAELFWQLHVSRARRGPSRRISAPGRRSSSAAGW